MKTALQIYGGYSIVQELPVQRHFRDCKITEIYEGMKTLFGDLDINHQDALKGNKAAAIRARQATIFLEKAGKKYRKESLAADKN